MPVRILLVEDNPADVVLFKELLKDSGLDFSLTTAIRISDGMSLLKSNEFDLAILDLSLPDCQGLCGYITVASEYPDVPVIILTGLDDQEIATRAVRMGAQDYLVKGTVEPASLRRILTYSIERHKAIRALKNESDLDYATGVYNRRGFESAAKIIINQQCSSAILLYVDVDGLKWINDNLGHLAGDYAIARTAAILKQITRPTDIVARLGGDEFVALLNRADGLTFEGVLDRLSDAVSQENRRPDRQCELSISVGIVKQWLTQENFLDGIAAAEKLMYESKSRKNFTRSQPPRGGMRATHKTGTGFDLHAVM